MDLGATGATTMNAERDEARQASDSSKALLLVLRLVRWPSTS